MNRPILRGTIRRARRIDRIAISAPGDFVLDGVTALDRAQARDAVLLPYCLDVLRQRSLYVGGVDNAEAQAAPFYYLHLRRNATRVVSVPWEQGALDGGVPRAPVFLFSPGRCGSTLLSRLLCAAGIANVSEPDFYTQATTTAGASPFNPLRGRMARAAAAMGADLSVALGAAPVVKLRAESCRAPDLLVQPQERRTLFMTRGFENWARSNGRAFRNSAAKSVRKYLTAMSGHAWLKANSDCHLLRYEDLLAKPLATAQALSRFLDVAISAQAVASTMNEDSQEGTPLQRGARPDGPDTERRFDETMALWNSARVRRARERLGADE